jgi:hypothetical protein
MGEQMARIVAVLSTPAVQEHCLRRPYTLPLHHLSKVRTPKAETKAYSRGPDPRKASVVLQHMSLFAFLFECC